MPHKKADFAQMGFVFDPPQAASLPAELAGLERQISGAVATILREESSPREVVAAQMSVLLDEEVSRAMLDAYASPAREGHKVIMSRFLALVAVCVRHDVLDQVMRTIGAAVLVGEEVHTARLGHIDQEIARLKAERSKVAASAPLIREGRVK